MNKNYIIPDSWSIIEEGFYPEHIESSESIFSLGNGAMGQRANFEEDYSEKSLQGSYIAGVYYPDKTKVGWWKNGYPEYFAKVINAPNWIGIHVEINGETLDLAKVKVSQFRRELNMKEGWMARSFQAKLRNGCEVAVKSIRFLSLNYDEIGAIKYSITPLNCDADITCKPYLDAGIKNTDTNWDDQFWEITQVKRDGEKAFIEAHTLKTFFHTCTYMQSQCFVEDIKQDYAPKLQQSDQKISFEYAAPVQRNCTFSIYKYGGYVVDRNCDKDQLISRASNNLDAALKLGFEKLLVEQKKDWKAIWDMSDIVIQGDVKAQQGIRFNIFHLNQTYLGVDPRLNIGPKGFTGEKYGGSTYWDTEAYCLPFYMCTKPHEVARNLLEYRYKHLGKAIENAEKLGFENGAALYPMVTMNGEECHNEWEITFEEIHRNGAIAYAIYNYAQYTRDEGYIVQKGLEVLIGIARFWQQRANFSQEKNKYVILGVTGPNEYENNVNNNWYTNYIAKWCIEYTIENIKKIKKDKPADYLRISDETKLLDQEIKEWQQVSNQLYFPYSGEHQVFLQQEGFLDKDLTVRANQLPRTECPINQKWSWDRILRSPYIKQADTLQGFYFFEDQFSKEELERHFDFYEPFTVHESSLSPCVHSILAARLGRMKQAYSFYLQTSRLDLDDYNHEVHEGLHITSMAGTWMSIVQGFGGMRIKNNTLSFHPQIPKLWEAYSFKINFRGTIITITVSRDKTVVHNKGKETSFMIYDQKVTLASDQSITANHRKQ